MAQNQTNFGVGFQVDKTGLNDLKKSLQDIVKLGQQKSATGNLEGDLKEACQAAQKLETILNGAWNSKLGQLNLDKVNQGIKQTYHSVEDLQKALGKTPQGQAAFNKMASQVLNTNLQLKQTNKLLDNMATSMANTVKWGITSSIFNNMTRSVQDAFYYVKSLNSSLTDIRIVTGASADQMASFAEKANAAAKALGQTTRNYTDASLIYYQQGLSEADVEARTQTTLKAANVTGQSTEEVSELLTSVWNGYKVSAAEAEMYIDKIAAVATTTASDLEELSIGMSKVASAASLMGVDIDQLNAQLATIVSVTRQAPESVGTALKTIYARMGDIEAGLDGETTLGNYTEQMKEMGFNVLDAQGKLRDMGGVIEEIGGKWSSMTREQQLSLAQTVAGTRQYNNLLALFDNWDMYTNALNTSSQAMGTLQEQNDIYMESTVAHLKQLQAELESTYSSMLNTDTLNTAIDGVTALAETFNDFIEGLGGGGQALTYFGSMAVNVFSKQIGASLFQTLENIKSVKANLAAFKEKEDFSKAVLKDVNEQHLVKGEKLDDSALAKEAQYAQKTLQVRKALTDEQYKQFTAMQAEIGSRERELNYLREYKNLSDTIMDYDDASAQALEERLALEEKLLSSRKARKDQTSQELKNYERVQPENEEDTAYLQERLGTLGNIVATEQEYVQLETILDKLATGKNLTEEENALILELEARTVQEQTKLVQQLQQAIKGRKAAEDGTLELLEAQQKAQEELLQQEQERAEKQAKLQTAVQTLGTALEIGTALVNAMAVGFDKASSGAEKANAAFAGITGVAAGIMDYFMPGTGILVQGAFSLVKAGLEAAGAWDWIEDKFKTTAEKIAEIDEAVNKISQSESRTNSQISSLKAIEEEYALLSQKAGQYGENLDSMTEAEQARYAELTSAFTQYNDSVIIGYDDQGRAIVDNQTALQETIDLLQRMHEEEARTSLGNISEGMAAKDQEIKDAEVEKNKYLPFGTKQTFSSENLPKVSLFVQDIGRELDLLTEEAKASTLKVGNVEYTIDELLTKINSIGWSSKSGQASVQDLEFAIEGLQSLTSLFEESNNFAEIDKRGTKKDRTPLESFEEFKEDDPLEDIYAYIKDYEDTIANASESLKAADQHLQELQNFDVNYIMDILRFGEGYDDQWDSLSDQGRDVGYNLLLQYLDGIKYGAGQGQADSYSEVVTMGQDFIVGLNTAMEQGFASIQLAADSFNQEQLNSEVKMTFEERANAIKEIITEEISKIENFEGLDANVKEALELMFENAFNVDLDLDNTGNITDFTDKTAAYIDDAKYQIEQAAQKNLVNGDVQIDFLQGLFDEGSLSNVNSIIQNIDWSSVRAGTLSLTEAIAQAVEESKSLISQLREEAQLGETVLSKLKNKEELEDSEASYLSKLEAENEILNGLIRGTDEYNQALAELIATRKDAFNDQLNAEVGRINDKIQAEKTDNDNLRTEQAKYAEGSKKYEEIEALIKVNDSEIQNYQSYLSNLKYEIFCLVNVKAEPDIASQIRNLYSDADTLISIKATLEKDEALSAEQTDALSSFFASEEGSSYLKEFSETGQITDEMLSAMEQFAFGLEKAAKGFKDSLQQDIDDLLQKAKEAEEMGNTEEADSYRMQAAEKAGELAQINTQEIANIATDIDSLEELNEAMENGRYEADQLSEAMDTVAENILKAEGIDTDGFEDYVEVLEDMYEQTGLTTTQIKKMAIQDKILAKGLDNLNKNFKTWSKSLKATSKGNEDWSDTVSDMTECVEDLTGIKVSEDFFNLDTEEGIRNLELLEAAMSGTQEDLLNLQEAATKDLIINGDIQLSPEMQASVLNEVSNVYDMMQSMLDSGELTVGQNVNDGPLLAALSNIVSACASSASEAEAMLARMGFDAEVVEDETAPTDITTTYTGVEYAQAGELPVGDSQDEPGRVVRSVTPSPVTETVTSQQGGAKATALKVKSATYTGGGNIGRSGSAPRGGGGGTGGGGKGKGSGSGKGPKKVGPRKKNYYHNVNNRLTKLGTQYDKLAEQQEKAFGKKHIENLKEINTNLDKQIDKMRERIKIGKEQEKKDLKDNIKKNFKEVKFNKDGTIKNYEEVLQKYYNKYKNAKTQEGQDKAKEKYDELKKALDEYETFLLETLPEWEAEMREKIDERYENLIHQFEYEIEMRINWGETDRDVREFFKDFNGEVEGIKTGLSELDFEGLANFEKMQLNSFINSGELTSKTRQIGDIIGEIQKIDNANKKGYKITNPDEEKYFSSVYGDDKNKAMEDLRKLREGLMGDLEKMKDSRNNAYAAYLDAIDDGIEKFDKHIEQYEMINEEISHNMNLIEMLYGETSDMMEAQYDLQESSYLGQLTSLKKISDTYKSQWEDEKKIMAEMEKNGDTTSQAYAEAKERAEIYEEAYNESVSNLQKTTEEAVQNLIDEYAFGVKKTLDNMANSLFSSKDNPTFNTALTEWELMEKESSMYLDNINAAFEIQKLESKYRDALNSTDSVAAQKKLNEAMEYELGVLREKDKLSQYEIDRANLQYELTLKQIALEEAQQNKSKMRLRRDAQGNYSYQFTADTDNINKAKEEVNDVLQQLTNLSQEKGKEIYNTALNETQNFIERMAEIETMADGAEKDRLRALTQENYNRVMGDLMSQSELVENHIYQLVDGPLAEIMSKEEQLFVGDKGISTQVINLTKTLRDNIAGKGGMANITGIALQEIKDKSDAYKTSLEQIETATGKAFKQLSSEKYVNGIKTKIGDLTTATNGLASSWKTTLKNIKSVITKMDDALKKSKKVQKALNAVKAAETKEKKEYKAAGDAAEQANIALINPPLPDPQKPIKQEPEQDLPKPKPTKTPKKKIKVGGKVKAKGNILNYDGSSAGRQYFSSDPKYKVLKISGNLVQVRWHKLSSGVTGYFKKSQLTPLRSGGYTGDWNGDGGKVALLHKKELVLNQKDTQNILDAVNIIRGLSGLLQNSMINRIEGLTQSLNGLSLPTVQTNSETGPQAIEQTVHITAEFPGATEALQIETALNNLVNRASQYAFRKE